MPFIIFIERSFTSLIMRELFHIDLNCFIAYSIALSNSYGIKIRQKPPRTARRETPLFQVMGLVAFNE